MVWQVCMQKSHSLMYRFLKTKLMYSTSHETSAITLQSFQFERSNLLYFSSMSDVCDRCVRLLRRRWGWVKVKTLDLPGQSLSIPIYVHDKGPWPCGCTFRDSVKSSVTGIQSRAAAPSCPLESIEKAWAYDPGRPRTRWRDFVSPWSRNASGSTHKSWRNFAWIRKSGHVSSEFYLCNLTRGTVEDT